MSLKYEPASEPQICVPDPDCQVEKSLPTRPPRARRTSIKSHFWKKYGQFSPKLGSRLQEQGRDAPRKALRGWGRARVDTHTHTHTHTYIYIYIYIYIYRTSAPRGTPRHASAGAPRPKVNPSKVDRVPCSHPWRACQWAAM